MTLRRWIVLGIVAVVIIFLLVTCMGNISKSSQGSAEDTARNAIEAISSKDVEKVKGYFTPIPGAVMANQLRQLYSRYDSIDIQDVTVMIVLEEGSAARVQAVYDMVLHNGDFINVQHCKDTIKLVKIEKKWYVNEAF